MSRPPRDWRSIIVEPRRLLLLPSQYLSGLESVWETAEINVDIHVNLDDDGSICSRKLRVDLAIEQPHSGAARALRVTAFWVTAFLGMMFSATDVLTMTPGPEADLVAAYLGIKSCLASHPISQLD